MPSSLKGLERKFKKEVNEAVEALDELAKKEKRKIRASVRKEQASLMKEAEEWAKEYGRPKPKWRNEYWNADPRPLKMVRGWYTWKGMATRIIKSKYRNKDVWMLQVYDGTTLTLPKGKIEKAIDRFSRKVKKRLKKLM